MTVEAGGTEAWPHLHTLLGLTTKEASVPASDGELPSMPFLQPWPHLGECK